MLCAGTGGFQCVTGLCPCSSPGFPSGAACICVVCDAVSARSNHNDGVRPVVFVQANSAAACVDAWRQVALALRQQPTSCACNNGQINIECPRVFESSSSEKSLLLLLLLLLLLIPLLICCCLLLLCCLRRKKAGGPVQFATFDPNAGGIAPLPGTVPCTGYADPLGAPVF